MGNWTDGFRGISCSHIYSLCWIFPNEVSLQLFVLEMNRWRFSIERKTFSISCSKELVKFGEKSKALQILVTVEVELIKWLRTKLRSCLEGEKRLGYEGSRRGRKMDLAVIIKHNRGGMFLSLFLLGLRINPTVENLSAFPSRNFEGWRLFLNSLDWMANTNPGVTTVEIRRKQIVEKVLAVLVCNEIVHDLRNELVVLTANEDIINWDEVAKTASRKVQGLGTGKVVELTKRRALIDVGNLEDRNKYLHVNSIDWKGVIVTFSSWSPGCDTLKSA